MIAICITTFGAGIKNGTLTPYIVDDFGLPVEAGTWMAIMSGIGAVAFNPIFGRLADIYQRKTIAVIGVAISAVGYLLNVISPTYEIALVGWILMSFVMGAMLPAAPAYVASHYTGKQATRAMGIYPALSVLGFALGPLLAGWFVDLSGWRFACGMGAAITLVGAVMIFLMFPWAKKEELSQDRRID